MSHPADRLVAWLPQGPLPWWMVPAGMAFLGTASVVAASVVTPTLGSEQLTAFGEPFGGTCTLVQLWGIPCAQCGMTRSWVWLVRGHLLQSFTYNPAGATLLLSLIWTGVVGWYRLLTRRPDALRLHWRITAVWWVFWAAVLLMGLWILRLGGLNRLPGL